MDCTGDPHRIVAGIVLTISFGPTLLLRRLRQIYLARSLSCAQVDTVQSLELSGPD
jgi:hypothetical protein